MSNIDELLEENLESIRETGHVVVPEKKYELRPLVASDMGAICKIISAIGIRQFKECFKVEDFESAVKIKKIAIEKAKEEGLDEAETKAMIAEAIEREQNKAGFAMIFDIVGIVISNYPKAEKEIQMFAANLTGMKLAEVENMPFADFSELIMEVVMKEDFRDFFGRVMKLFNR